ncbi:alpha-glucosidase [Lentinula novae-zelandiae]|nr:alpha-glucosidase [Lentinula novae-zelandiae]
MIQTNIAITSSVVYLISSSSQGSTFTAKLVLAGTACNVFGSDLKSLSLAVIYETENRIHVKIMDANGSRYKVPKSVLPRPNATFGGSISSAAIQFNYTTSPFSFTIYRTSMSEVLFTTAAHPLIFEPQYLRVKTVLPPNANIYGLGTNLYGNHPIYFKHCITRTHGIFLLKINDTESMDRSMPLKVIGGMLDFYFLAGSETDPLEVSKQYTEVVGTPAEVPYWSFELHKCRFGYTSYIDVTEVITNCSEAGIPLEIIWTDIVLMTDPVVAYAPGEGYGTYNHGSALDVWLKMPNGSAELALVWPGNAPGRLYVNDGVSLEQTNGTTALTFDDQDEALSMNGTFGYNLGANVAT